VSLDNGTIRMVNGAVGSDGGTADFTSVFRARTITQANIPNYNLSVSDPGHTHLYTSTTNGSPRNIAAGTNFAGNGDRTTGASFTGISVNSGGSGIAMDFAVKYADAIRATKI